MLLSSGIFFTVGSKFFQIRYIKKWLSLIFNLNSSKNKNKISPFAALSTALAGAMGTGNIIGVSCALALGGPGAVFWMWLASFFSMMTIFAENVLGVIYRKKDKTGKYHGGPMYYINNGLKCKKLSLIFCLACIGSSFGVGNMVQANSLALTLKSSFNIPNTLVAAVLSFATCLVIIGGIKRISNITEKIIPFITLFFMLGGIIVILHNYKNLPEVFNNIFKGAFCLKSASGGAGGFIIANAIKFGVSKGVFSNEAGLGSSPIIYSESEVSSSVEAGMWGIIQVFIDTIIGCSITALCILSFNPNEININDGTIDTCVKAFSSVLGKFGIFFVSFSIVIFAFATIISWSYYAEKSLYYMFRGKFKWTYKILYCIFAGVGCMLNLNMVWDIADIFNALMAIPNVIAILLLSKHVFKAIKSWEQSSKVKI